MRKFFCGLVLTVALVACGCELFFPPNPSGVSYEMVIWSWEGRQIDEMLQFRYWRKWANGHKVRICPQDKECAGYPPNVAKLHILRRGGVGACIGNIICQWETACKTTVAVDDKGKILSIAPGNISACNQAMTDGYTAPGLAPGWNPYPTGNYPDTPYYKPYYYESVWPYHEMLASWWGGGWLNEHQIDELLEYGNWGPPTRILKCPKECEALPTITWPETSLSNSKFKYWDYKRLSEFHDISEVYVWRIVGHTKPPNLVYDDKVGYKDDYTLGRNNTCLTEVYVSNKSKDPKYKYEYKKGRIVWIHDGNDGNGFLGCHSLIRHGVWSPKVAPGWYDPPRKRIIPPRD